MLDAIFDTECGFGETLEYLPGGDESLAFALVGVVCWADEEGSNQNPGEGRSQLNRDRGRKIRSVATIELPTFRPDDCEPLRVRPDGSDRIKVTEGDDTLLLVVKRVIGHDAGSQTVLCHKTTEVMATGYRERMG